MKQVFNVFDMKDVEGLSFQKQWSPHHFWNCKIGLFLLYLCVFSTFLLKCVYFDFNVYVFTIAIHIILKSSISTPFVVSFFCSSPQWVFCFVLWFACLLLWPNRIYSLYYFCLNCVCFLLLLINYFQTLNCLKP